MFWMDKTDVILQSLVIKPIRKEKPTQGIIV